MLTSPQRSNYQRAAAKLHHNHRADISSSVSCPPEEKLACESLTTRNEEGTMGVFVARHQALVTLIGALMMIVGVWVAADRGGSEGSSSDFLRFSAPAGNRPATTNTIIDGVSAAVLPNGRLVTPAGVEVNVQAPKPFGLALSPDGNMLATLNSGAAPFSLTLISQLTSQTPAVKRVDVNASFMGVTFSPDSRRVYLS